MMNYIFWLSNIYIVKRLKKGKTFIELQHALKYSLNQGYQIDSYQIVGYQIVEQHTKEKSLNQGYQIIGYKIVGFQIVVYQKLQVTQL